jgi:hypothetical protein
MFPGSVPAYISSSTLIVWVGKSRCLHTPGTLLAAPLETLISKAASSSAAHRQEQEE